MISINGDTFPALLEKGGSVEWHNSMGHDLFLDKVDDVLLINGHPVDLIDWSGRTVAEYGSTADSRVVNGNCLMALLNNEHLIPSSWREKAVFAIGTGYRNRHNARLLACMIYDQEDIVWGLGHCVTSEKMKEGSFIMVISS